MCLGVCFSVYLSELDNGVVCILRDSYDLSVLIVCGVLSICRIRLWQG